MREYKLHGLGQYQDKNVSLLTPIIILWTVAFAIFGVMLWSSSELSSSNNRYYLIPWCLMTGAVIVAPSAYLIYKKEFDPFHPLVFAAWSFFFPGFFIGGLLLATGVAEPYYLVFVQDEQYNLPLTMTYIALGYGGLSLGFFLPFGRFVGGQIRNRLPAWDWKAERIILPGLLLLGIGLVNTGIAFNQGTIGYQEFTESSIFDGLLFLLSFLLLEATFALWLCVFRLKYLNIAHYLIIGVLILTTIAKAAFQGSRGSLIQAVYVVAIAFVFSGRVIKAKHWATASILIACAVIVGMIYGTTFRSLKQANDQMGADRYSEVIVDTIGQVSEQDLFGALQFSLLNLADRMESVTSLAVVVSTYEQLQPFEESYGLEDNIWKESLTFFIPRVFWPDKPIPSEPRRYSDLYFNYAESSFAITPMGDLLRNFGPFGVPLGMLFLGFVIRIVYSSLKEDQEFSFWRSILFFMILLTISYEGFYATIIPYMFKITVIALLGVGFIWIFAREKRPYASF